VWLGFAPLMLGGYDKLIRAAGAGQLTADAWCSLSTTPLEHYANPEVLGVRHQGQSNGRCVEPALHR
jgi:hypothetical protein